VPGPRRIPDGPARHRPHRAGAWLLIPNPWRENLGPASAGPFFWGRFSALVCQRQADHELRALAGHAGAERADLAAVQDHELLHQAQTESQPLLELRRALLA